MTLDTTTLCRYVFDAAESVLGGRWSQPKRAGQCYVRRCLDKRHLSGAPAKDAGDIYLTDTGTIGEVGGRDHYGVLDYIAAMSGRSVRDVCTALRAGAGLSLPTTQTTTTPPTPPPTYLSDVPTLATRIAATIADETATPDNLGALLWRVFGRDRAAEVLRAYNVGRDKQGRAVYWYTDATGRVSDGKAIPYQADGHRDRAAKRPCEWYYAACVRAGLLPTGAVRAKNGLFGAHLLPSDTNTPICVVEACKTAIIGRLAYPSHVWVATGGKGGLSADTITALQRYTNVTYWCDVDAADDWRHTIQTAGVAATFGNVAELAAVLGVECGSHDDIADVLLRAYTADAPTSPQLARALALNPQLQVLIDRFGLVEDTNV